MQNAARSLKAASASLCPAAPTLGWSSSLPHQSAPERGGGEHHLMSVGKDWLYRPGARCAGGLASPAAGPAVPTNHRGARGSQTICRFMFAADTTHNISAKSRIVNSIRHFFFFYSAIGLLPSLKSSQPTRGCSGCAYRHMDTETCLHPMC